VIPLYNHARFIEAAIDSALRQGPILREMVVVDDGSTDDSATIARGLAEADPRIVFWSQPNRGAHAAINAGIQRASGELPASRLLTRPDALSRTLGTMLHSNSTTETATWRLHWSTATS
jgi:glycosyltransferase involved in cell wall biosynthesis